MNFVAFVVVSAKVNTTLVHPQLDTSEVWWNEPSLQKYLPLGEHAIERINDLQSRGKTMTPSEELYAKIFSGHAPVVAQMSDLDLNAHREELAKIIFEAKACIGAADSEITERKKRKRKADGPTGFERNLNIDETSSDAINTIKERQKKLTAMEKIQKKLMEIPGMDAGFAEGVTSARNIKAQIDKPTIQNHAPVDIGKSEEVAVTPQTWSFNKKD